MQEYAPNHIPKSTRLFNIFWALLLVGVCIYGLYSGSITYPGARGSGPVEFSGYGLWFLCSGLLSAAINAVLTIIDHYDKRNNETQYRKISDNLNIIGIISIVFAFAFQFANDHKATVIVG